VLFSYSQRDHPDIHSFPTRRSSDLINEPYKLKGKVQEPKEVTLADYFGDKKKITPARLLDNIDKKHKVHDLEESERDPYIALTNDFNLIFRQETVLPAVIQASEDKSVKVNTEELAKDIMTISGIEKFKYGGKVTKKGVTQHNPALISGALEAVTGL